MSFPNVSCPDALEVDMVKLDLGMHRIDLLGGK
jgi:hypothetical protein